MPMGLGIGIGVITYPVMVYGLLRRQSGPVTKFLQAGAISPETARRPESLKMYADFLLRDAVRRGTLKAMGDGRYFVDVPVYRRRRRRLITALVAIGGMLAAAAAAVLLAKSA
jgi:hypothetical protein